MRDWRFCGRGWRAVLALGLAVGCFPAWAGEAAAAADTRGRPVLHVPSPDWRDQVIYFVMIDRFEDGDPRNNNQGEGEFDPADNARYSGGDIKGVTRRLDYIRGLGATAVWITPPVAHQWWNQATRYGGYHGYWAEDFKRVDAHFGTLRDYRDLSRALHGAGMYLIQDVVVNHTANYFGYAAGTERAGDPAAGFVLHPATANKTAPTREPFSWNDARNPRHRAAGIYHWTPDITDFSDRRQELNYQLQGLDDLDTENPLVRDALRDAYGYWIREAGVDAFRVDTAFYVPQDYFADFLDSPDRRFPGMRRVAAATGREDFHVFGEGFGIDKAFNDTQARKIDSYMRDENGRQLLPGMINFPLHGTLLDVFARGRPTAELGHRIGNMMTVHARPHLMPTFVDNHDVDRFLAGGNEAGLKQALLAILTLPGIPTIYYGTEQGLKEQRAAMFAHGYGSGGRDRFDTDAPLYRFVQRAIALRRGHRVFSRGTPEVLGRNEVAPGVLAYRMSHEGDAALVAFNSADHEALLEGVATGLPPGTVLKSAFSIDDGVAAPELVVGADGRITLPLPARAGMVWLAQATRREVVAPMAAITLDSKPQATTGERLELAGSAHGVTSFRLVIDGNLAEAVMVRPDARGRWQARLDVAALSESAGAPLHRVIAWDPVTGVLSSAHAFEVTREWTLLADVDDPAGDDAGPAGRYAYPTEPQWRAARPLDLRRIRVYGAAGALKVELTTQGRVAAWRPPNGFDHAVYNLFVQLPGLEGGTAAMPLQNADLPDGMRWHLRTRTSGWTNALFGARGAGPASEGEALAPAAALSLGPGPRTVTLILPAKALGRPRSFSGLRLYANTWDFDAGYRPLQSTAGEYEFGGGDGRTDPLWMDESGVITLP